MFDIALLLGPVAFRDFEIPSGINFGGAQRVAVHRLAGGTRVIDSLGRDDADITFSGTFSGGDATLRARLLDELRASGLTLPLTWDVFFYTVVIRTFQADYQNGAWIPYRLTCTVLRDEASALVETAMSLAADALADIASASGLAASGGTNLGPLLTVLSAPGATVRDTAAYTTAQATVAGAQATTNQAISTAEGALNGAGLVGAVSAPTGITALAGVVAASQQLASLTAAQAYLGRTRVNLANAGT